MNPVRTGMAGHPSKYQWASYAVNAAGNASPLVIAHALYLQLGGDVVERRHAYRELFRPAMDETQLHQLREALDQDLVLGREDFKNKIERMTKRQVRRGMDGRPAVEDVLGEYDMTGSGMTTSEN